MSEDFWTTSTCGKDNSAVQSQGSISSISTSNQTLDASGSGNGNIHSEFVNHGLLRWNQTRQQWVENKKSENHTKQLCEPRLSIGYSWIYLGTFALYIIWLFLLNWNATYESLLRSNKPLNKPIPLGVLFILALMTPAVMDWIAHGNVLEGKQHIASYVVLSAALMACGFADGLIAGSLIRATQELSGCYMPAVFAGSGSSGIFVSILRIEAALHRTPKGLRIAHKIYFIISTLIILVCSICYNLLLKLSIIQHYCKQNHHPQNPKSRCPTPNTAGLNSI